MLGCVNKAQLIIILFVIPIFTIAFFYIREKFERKRKYEFCRKSTLNRFYHKYPNVKRLTLPNIIPEFSKVHRPKTICQFLFFLITFSPSNS